VGGPDRRAARTRSAGRSTRNGSTLTSTPDEPIGNADDRPPARRRIIDAALDLTANGGYDGLQVRTLSELAQVSSRTIYKQFPSLDALIVVAVSEQFDELYAGFMRSPPSGPNAVTRVDQLVAYLAETLTANRALTGALLRALLSGKADVAHHVREFAETLQGMLAIAISPNGPTAHDREAAKILESIWFTELIGWASEADIDSSIGDITRVAARTLLASHSEQP
jgi:TetR/AcrR family transcriptional regulator, cholesterol catabolism regulator